MSEPTTPPVYRDRKWVQGLVAVAIVLGLIGLIVAGWYGKRWNDRRIWRSKHPELARYFDQCRQIKVGMTEPEVDSIMLSYPVFVHEEKRESNTYTLQAYERPSVRTKIYDIKLGANEGDYFCSVDFETDGCVLSKYIGVYIS